MSAQYLTHESLSASHLRHAFFTRQGGISTGVYTSLNGGTGSNDDPKAVQHNRGLMAQALTVSGERFLVPYQIHSADVVIARDIWQERPRVDGLVTNVPGLAIGVTGADCGMILFADHQARVIGACHAGWKSALTGVLENTLTKMEELGAKRANISAVLGPTIGATSYEVGPEFVARLRQVSPRRPRDV